MTMSPLNPKASRFAIALLSPLWPLLLGSCAKFPDTDIQAVIRNRSATYITDATGTEFSRYYGYSTGDCAHPGAHALFPTAGTYPVYAALDGIVRDITDCSTAGANDKYDISLTVGRRGATPVILEYSLEPFAGTVCSNGAGSFASQILVSIGQEVKQGDVIARITTVGSSAHVHFNLKIDGATVCPELFPSSTIAALTPTASVSASCAALHTAGNLCVQPTTSEDPSRLLQ